MCSIIFSSKRIYNLQETNFFTKFRGPDKTVHKKIEKFDFVHNLLSITGKYTPQPFEQDGIVVVYNGEIYNFSEIENIDNDGKCLIPFYKKYGDEFVKYLDGEFALVLVDFNKEKILISSDVFRSKPIFWAYGENELGVSTYRTPLEKLSFNKISSFPANTCVVLDFEYTIKRMFTVVDFNLKQYKNTFEDWNVSFSNAINKRCKDHVRENIFVGLSSGYDSGSIVCEMEKQGIEFKCYSHKGKEDMDILEKRKDFLKNEVFIYSSSRRDRIQSTTYICDNTEEFNYTINSSRTKYNEYNRTITSDWGAINFSKLCSLAKRDGKKIHISGMGADEIFSDYGHGGNGIYKHSNFGGLFPCDLREIFPWNSFYNSTMESYLAKEEYVGGSYGIESRYPFLDKQVVQEFLNLTPNLKNENYKNVLYNYLTQHDFPTSFNKKIGFCK